MIYRAKGKVRAIQIHLGHTKIEKTGSYLGVDAEDALGGPSEQRFDPSGRSAASFGRPLFGWNQREATGDNWVGRGHFYTIGYAGQAQPSTHVNCGISPTWTRLTLPAASISKRSRGSPPG